MQQDHTIEGSEFSSSMPGAPADLRAALIGALRERWPKTVNLARKARQKPGEKSIHDLRVALRRLIALLEILDPILPGERARGLRKKLKAHLSFLSSLRDIQVQILHVESLVESYGFVSPFLAELKARESTQSKRTRKDVERTDLSGMQVYFDRLEERLADFLSDPVALDAATSIVMGTLSAFFVKTISLRKEIAAGGGKRVARIHKLRILFKRFRYTVEVLQPVLPGVSRELFEPMSAYQTSMGAIQDTAVLMESIKLFVAKRSGKNRKRFASGLFAELAAELSRRLNEETQAFILKMDELDEYWSRITTGLDTGAH